MLVWAVAVAMIVTGAGVWVSKQQPGNDWLPIDLHTLKMSDGWGYEVLVDKKVFIHQDCIPAIASYKRFSTESEALLIGNKVVDKIKKGQKPAITQQDINDSHIRY